ncbi:MAG: PAS domain-containing protein, partial [Pseudomonadota bacterium]
MGRAWAEQALEQAPVPAAAMATGAIFACAAMGLAALVVIVRVRAQYRLLRSALNNMTQGLCMFDASARLVLCNERYIEMYHLPPEDARQGTPLRDLLTDRAAAGTFSSDVDRYIAELAKQVGEGRTETKTIEINDGRTIALVSRPMANGGWLATHTDVTEQLLAEKERDALRQREERRRVIDAAISSFRERVESVLKTVGQSAAAMKMAAKTLLATSDHTLRRTEGAVHGSNE